MCNFTLLCFKETHSCNPDTLQESAPAEKRRRKSKELHGWREQRRQQRAGSWTLGSTWIYQLLLRGKHKGDFLHFPSFSPVLKPGQEKICQQNCLGFKALSDFVYSLQTQIPGGSFPPQPSLRSSQLHQKGRNHLYMDPVVPRAGADGGAPQLLWSQLKSKTEQVKFNPGLIKTPQAADNSTQSCSN